jgi:PASTA domain-containing protein
MRRLVLILFVVLATGCDQTAEPLDSTGPSSPTESTTGPPPPQRVKVPKVKGLNVSDARSTLRSAGLHPVVGGKLYSDQRRGTVLRQAVGPGTEVRPDRVVRLIIAKPIPQPVNGNPWGYNFVCCRNIYNPPGAFCSFFNCIPYFSSGNGFVIQCEDGAFSQSGGISGSCSSHGGNGRELLSMPGG